MKRIFFVAIVLILITPSISHAAPLCSDGSAAPGGNICNCAVSASIGGSTFTPGASSGLTGNSFGGIQFSGVGGALASCTNIGGTICKAASSLFSGVSCNSQSSGTGAAEQKVPTNDKTTADNTQATANEEAKTTRREQCLNGAAYAVAKTALQSLSNKTLNWIRTGLGGNPFYVRDIDSYLNSVKNEKLYSYLQSDVVRDNPIFGNALESVIKQQVTGYTDNVFSKVMNTPEALQYQAFQDDFTNGGWGALLNMNNNPVGAYFKAVDKVSYQINNTQQNIRDELQQGQGFLSMRKCVEYDNASTPSTLSSTYTAPTNYGTPTASNSCSIIYSQNYQSCCTTVGGSATNQTQCNAYLHGYQSSVTSTSITKPKCVRYEVVTPGSLISNQLQGITNSTTEVLINADQINEVLGSFFDQLMNRLFTDGVTGAGRGSTNTFSNVPGGFGTNVVTGTNGQTLASAQSCQTPLGYNAATGGFNDEFDISRPQQLKAVIETQKSFLTRSQDAQYKMQQVVPLLGALDYCIPGPNPTRNEALNDNAQTFVSLLQEVTSKDNNILVTVNHILDPGHVLCGIFSNSSNCSNDTYTVGYTTSRVSLFDKVDGQTKRISDRAYQTGNSPTVVSNFFSDTLAVLKAQIENRYSDQNIINAFAAVANTQAEKDFISDQMTDAIKLTGNLTGFAQGIADYNAAYNTDIQNTQDALVELEDIYNQILGIVGPAKAYYIYEMAHADIPVTINQSCLDNAYKLDPLGPGLPHLENITASPIPEIQTSANASTYFYNNL